MIGINGLGHVTLKVRDIDRTLAFYSEVLGLPEIMRLHHDDGRLFLVYLRITDTSFIEVFPDADSERAPGPRANGINHLCLTVDDIEETLRQVVARGGILGEWLDGILTPTSEAVIYDGADGNRQAWIEDPDGNRIEFMQMDPDCLQYQGLRKIARWR